MRLEDIPFTYAEPFALLGFDETRTEPDDAYEGFGWTRVSGVELVGAETGKCQRIDDALLVVAHTPDDAEPGSLVLEFWLKGDPPLAVQVALPPFLDHHVKPLLGPETSIVLVVCNPHRDRIARPSWLGARRFVYAFGDVTAWLVDGMRYRLDAERWILEPPA